LGPGIPFEPGVPAAPLGPTSPLGPGGQSQLLTCGSVSI